MPRSLREPNTHFAFGQNWASYSKLIGETELAGAVADLRRLLGGKNLKDKAFLDIGCGSGLHSAAAIRLGASSVTAVDIDADSVATTEAVLAKFAPDVPRRVERLSVFDLETANLGTFDVVYSWGVLHHTGDMVAALQAASAMVARGGVFLVALYRRTWLCSLWRLEKRWYASAPARAQRMALHVFVAWYRLLRWVRRGFQMLAGRRRRGDRRARGMEFYHDVHDWLGGYPYQSILPSEVDRLLGACGLQHEASFLCTPSRSKTHGLLGSACDEYRYLRPA